MVRLVREKDWSQTSLGARECWPQSLRTAVGTVLGAPTPMVLWWGPDHTLIYNDAYISILGSKHPHALGRSARNVWSEAWQQIQPLVEAVVQRGESIVRERDRFQLDRNGILEDLWITWTLSPVPDESGQIGGLLNTCYDETPQVQAERERDEVVVQRHQADERARTILESITDAFFALDREWRFTYLNRHAEAFMGRDRGGLLGQVIWDAYPNLRENDFGKCYRRVAGNQIAESITAYYADHDRWYELHVYPAPGGGISVYFRDVTERTRAEEQLQRSHDTFYNLIQNNPFGVYVVDADFRLRQVSLGSQKVFQNVRPLLGRPFGEVLREIWPEPFATEAIARFRHTLDTGECYSAPSTVERRRDIPDVEAYDWRTERVVLPDGRFGVVCYFYDLSERQRWEAALTETRRRLDSALIAGEVGTFEWDVVADRLWGDQNFARIFGIELDASGAAPIARYIAAVHPADQPWVAERVKRAVEMDSDYEAEYRITTSTPPRWVIARGKIERDDAGRALRFPGVVLDVTERKQAEQLLAAQNRALELVAIGAPLAEALGALTMAVEEQAGGQAIASVLLVDPDGCTLRTGAAPSLPPEYNAAIDGIKAAAGVGTCADAAARNTVVCTADLAAAPAWQGLSHLPLALGLVAAWSMPIRASDGRVLGTFGTYFRECREPSPREREVVEGLCRVAALAIEQRQGEEALHKAHDAAEAANRAKDKFLAVLSHELRTPLSPVVMTIPAIEIDPDLPYKFREDLAMVRRNIDLEVKLIDDLLDLSRVTSGKLRLQMQPVRIHDLLLHVLRSCANDTSSKRLNIRHEFSAGNDRLNGDSARLQQVFWNLLRNAVKFTPEGGDITIRTSNARGGGRLLVEVQDSGVGIRPDVLPRIFEAFEQGEVRMTRQFGGLGLGLAIAKAVVEMHGGTISATSGGQGRGATFTVQLATTFEKISPAPHSPGGGDTDRRHLPVSRVLLVEDHLDTARTLSRLLHASGYNVTMAHSAASALQLAAAEPFDIVVSDIGLPDATGYELMKQLRDRFGIKGIALSGYGMEEDMKRSREAGFVDHIVKPVNLPQLEAVIGRVLGGESEL